MNVFSLDTFVGTAPAANLTGHTGQLGATWSLVTGTSPVFTSTGYVRAAASGAAPVAASGTPGTADYDAEIVLISITLDSYAEIAIDINAGSDNYYSVGYGPRTSGTPANGGILEVVKVTAGTRSVLASLNVNLTVSQPYFLRASRRHTATGTILNLFVIDPVLQKFLNSSAAWVISPYEAAICLTATDSSSPLASGGVGVLLNGVANFDDTHGVQIAGWRCGDVGVQTASTLQLVENFNLSTGFPWYLTNYKTAGATLPTVATGVGQGGTNAVSFPETSQWTGVASWIPDSTIAGGAAGNSTITATFQFNGANGASATGINVLLRLRDQDNPVVNTTPKNFIGFLLGVGFSRQMAFAFAYSTNGEANAVYAGLISSITFTNTNWYTVAFSANDLVLSAVVTRSADGFYLTSAGAWQVGSATISYTLPIGSTVPCIEGPGLFGVSNYNNQSGTLTYLDSLTLASGSAAATGTPYTSLYPGRRQFDTAGNPLYFSGFQPFYDPQSNAYYLHAEAANTNSDWDAVSVGTIYPGVVFEPGILCWQSYDLMNWSPTNNGTDAAGYCFTNIVQTGWATAYPFLSRPRCLYVAGNAVGSQYVLWIHVENSTFSLVKFATFVGPTPYGPFTPSAPFSAPGPLGTQDFTLFTDPSGGANYVIFSPPGNIHVGTITSNGQGIAASPFDTGIASTDTPIMFKNSSTYYILTNPYAVNTETATALYSATGPTATWGAAGFNLFNSTGPEPYATGYRSQPSFIFPSQSGQLVYGGTRWAYGNTAASPGVWGYVDVSGTPTIKFAEMQAFVPSGALVPPAALQSAFPGIPASFFSI